MNLYDIKNFDIKRGVEMRIIVGPPVSGDDFMFREREVSLAVQSLSDGTSLLVKGWRRIGKSSLLTETARQINEKSDHTAILLDVQYLKSISEFFLELLRALPQQKTKRFNVLIGQARQLPANVMNAIQSRLKSAKGGAGGIEGAVEFDKTIRDYWDPLKDSVDTLAKQSLGAGERLVLLIDELPFFLENLYRQTENVDDIRMVLATLRAWRTAGLTMAIAGSVSIEAFLEDLGIEGLVINDLVRLDLKPLAFEEAASMVKELVQVAGMSGWSDTSTETLLSELPDHFPFFIQNAINTLRVENDYGPENIQLVFENHIYPQIFASFFQQFDERLENRFDGDDRKAAIAILNAMAAAKGGRISSAEIEAITGQYEVDALRVTRRLELAEFTAVDLRNSGFKLSQNLLVSWRRARGGVI